MGGESGVASKLRKHSPTTRHGEQALGKLSRRRVTGESLCRKRVKTLTHCGSIAGCCARKIYFRILRGPNEVKRKQEVYRSGRVRCDQQRVTNEERLDSSSTKVRLYA